MTNKTAINIAHDLLSTLLSTDLQIIALDIHEPDKHSIYQLIHNLIQFEDEKKFYKISLAQGLQAPIYKKQKIVNSKSKILDQDTIINWGQTKVLKEPQVSHLINHYLSEINNYKDDGVFIFEDWQSYLTPQNPNLMTVSLVKHLAHQRESNPGYHRKIILLGQDIELNPEIFRQIPIFKFPLPSEKAIAHDFRTQAANCGKSLIILEEEAEKLAQIANGLTFFETTYLFQIYQNLSNPKVENLKDLLLERKYQVLQSLGIEFLENIDFPEVGGHDRFKEWIKEVEVRRNKGVECGLPAPKGCILGGYSGTGKTLLAKFVSKAWNLPLFILNIPALKGSLVGESEKNLRKALDAINYQKGVVLIDEIEKSVTEGSGDQTGVSSGMLSILLFWLQQQCNNFVIATANNVNTIPQELLRAGRFNRRWFVDLPNQKERTQILKIHLTRQNRCELNEKELDNILNFIAVDSDRLSGAELEELVLQALTYALMDDRAKKPNLADFRNALSSIKALVKTFPQQQKKIIEWSKNADPTSFCLEQTKEHYYLNNSN